MLQDNHNAFHDLGKEQVTNFWDLNGLQINHLSFGYDISHSNFSELRNLYCGNLQLTGSSLQHFLSLLLEKIYQQHLVTENEIFTPFHQGHELHIAQLGPKFLLLNQRPSKSD